MVIYLNKNTKCYMLAIAAVAAMTALYMVSIEQTNSPDTDAVVQDSSVAAGTSSAVSSDGEVISGKCGMDLTYIYDINNHTLTIIGSGNMSDWGHGLTVPWCKYEKDITTVILPTGVTSIGDYAFCRCSSLTSVTIPRSVESIGECAFMDCYSLTSVTIPESVTSFGHLAFRGCYSLTSVTIPGSVTSIGYSAFEYCISLKSVTIPGSVTSIGYSAFADCRLKTVWNFSKIDIQPGSYGLRYNVKVFSDMCGDNLLWGFDEGTLTIYGSGAMYDYGTVADGQVPEVAPWFCFDANITSIVLSDRLTHIGDRAFMCCYTVTSVTIPDSVTSIGRSAFYYCALLTSVTIPGSVTSIGDHAFFGCNKLTSVTIPDSVTSIGGYAFCYCSKLTSVTIPDSVASIGEFAFRDCTALTSVTILGSVTSIGHCAFYHCNSLKAVYNYSKLDIQPGYFGLPDNVKVFTDECGEQLVWKYSDGTLTISGSGDMYDYDINIDRQAANVAPWCYFSGDIACVVLSDSLTHIGDCAFDGCSSLTSVTIGYSITSIGSYAFRYCNALTSVTIPGSVESIGGGAFAGCIALTSVTILGSVTSIDSQMFAGCSSLTSVTIPGSVTSIGGWAFCFCSKLTSVTIPNSVTSIGHCAFHGCSSLKTVYNFSKLEIQPDQYGLQEGVKVFSDRCGDNLVWGYSDETLTISGSGAMYDYDFAIDGQAPGIVPWQGFHSYIARLVLSDSITHIGDNAFAGCALESVTITDSVTSIGNNAFSDCSKLTLANIGSSVTSIGEGAFYGCSSLTSVVIPESVTSVGDSAFERCDSLKEIFDHSGLNIKTGDYGLSSDALILHNGRADDRMSVFTSETIVANTCSLSSRWS